MTGHRLYRYTGQYGQPLARCSCGRNLVNQAEIDAHQKVADAWQPYADGTSGQQGEASQAAEPGRAARLPDVLGRVTARGRAGATWKEVAAVLGVHHGTASGALSNLHRTGLLARLAERRDGCGVYVAPEHADGRDTVPHRSNKRVRACGCPCPDHPEEEK